MGFPWATPAATNTALGAYQMSVDPSNGMPVDVGEVAVAVQELINGDRGWWKSEGPHNGTVVDAADWLQG